MKVNAHAHCPAPVASEYGKVPKGDIVKTGPNSYQTYRYKIEINQGEVKVYDLKTKTFIKAWGDPHLHTSDGDKMQFHKNNVTIDLEDGTKLTLKPTAPDANGIALVDGVQILTKNGGAEVTNISGPGGPKGEMFADSAKLDRAWADGTVLEARGEIDDLHYKCGHEVEGADPSQRWGEHLLDGKGGKSDISFDQPIQQMDLRKILEMLVNALHRRMNPQQLKDLIGRIDDLLQGGQFQNPTQPPAQRPTNFTSLPPSDQVFPPLLDLRRNALDRLINTTRGTDGFKDGVMKQLDGLNGQIKNLENAIKSGQVDKDQLPMLQLELQELYQQRKQLIEMLTSISRTKHEEQMAVTRNLRIG